MMGFRRERPLLEAFGATAVVACDDTGRGAKHKRASALRDVVLPRAASAKPVTALRYE